MEHQLRVAAQEARGIDAQGKVARNTLLGIALDHPFGIGIRPQAAHS
jgi:hypothetical protein